MDICDILKFYQSKGKGSTIVEMIQHNNIVITDNGYAIHISVSWKTMSKVRAEKPTSLRWSSKG